MYKQLTSFSVILLFTLLTSCKSQVKPDLPKETTAQVEESKPDLSDHDPYFIETKYTTSPYGPNRITRNVLQAKNGDIWLATWEGIIRYDGKTFTNFTNKENLRRHHAFSLLEDSKGGALSRYDANFLKDKMVAPTIIRKETNMFFGIYEDDKNGIWLGTLRGALRYDGVSFEDFKNN